MNFETDNHLDLLIKQTIEDHHPHLSPDYIQGIFKGAEVGKKIGEPTRGKGPKLYTVSKQSDLQAFLHGQRFVIQIERAAWDSLDLNIQEAVIDEALSRCGKDDKGTYMIEPDCSIFNHLIQRHGYYTQAIKETAFSFNQLSLFPQEVPETVPEPETEQSIPEIFQAGS